MRGEWWHMYSCVRQKRFHNGGLNANNEASKANWTSPTDIKNEYPKASILKAGRVVFNICGNKYRLITHINYLRQWVFIRFIGTHTEYDKIDAEKI